MSATGGLRRRLLTKDATAPSLLPTLRASRSLRSVRANRKTAPKRTATPTSDAATEPVLALPLIATRASDDGHAELGEIVPNAGDQNRQGNLGFRKAVSRIHAIGDTYPKRSPTGKRVGDRRRCLVHLHRLPVVEPGSEATITNQYVTMFHTASNARVEGSIHVIAPISAQTFE